MRANGLRVCLFIYILARTHASDGGDDGRRRAAITVREKISYLAGEQQHEAEKPPRTPRTPSDLLQREADRDEQRRCEGDPHAPAATVDQLLLCGHVFRLVQL